MIDFRTSRLRPFGSCLALLLVIVMASSCAILTDDFPPMSGAEGLLPEHEKLLQCGGWLDFVETHVGTVTYVPEVSLEQRGDTLVVGRAFCRTGEIKIATLEQKLIIDGEVRREEERTDLFQAAIIVHEAYHHYESCAPGEENASRAESEFLRSVIQRQNTDLSC